MINLNNCVPGQKLRTRDGMILTYVGKDNNFNSNDSIGKYRHIIKYPCGYIGTRTDEGYFTFLSYRDYRDIVEILPLESDQTTGKFESNLNTLDRYPKILTNRGCIILADSPCSGTILYSNNPDQPAGKYFQKPNKDSSWSSWTWEKLGWKRVNNPVSVTFNP